ncbi:MAG TPA: 6-phosphogluconolactonase [Stellaceae bacterium]|jgi:glucosamine-6-phosphate deaminase|nr:6-phosphogluconolactonase [Stellaceae bacterium]
MPAPDQPKDYPLPVRVFATRREMGAAAAADLADFLRAKIGIAGHGVRVIFAAADSQRDMLESLIADQRLDWGRITAFHMDEYIGLPADAPQRLGNWLKRELIERVPIGRFHAISPEFGVEAAIEHYERLLAEAPIDAVCLGIGVNGHLAFNEPGSATDLQDRDWVKEIGLDPVSRQQQVDEGNFPSIAAMPETAITLTVPCLLSGERLFCMVPGKVKAPALRRALRDPIGPDCPATALRRHAHCTLYCDRGALPDE